MADSRKAILAGGCFWGMEDLIRQQPGVLSTRVGYTGGRNDRPTYRNHPGHAEAVEIVYDPAQTDYRALLEFFFQIHDPTTLNYQGRDFGSSYRSAIFYLDDDQKRVALGTIVEVEDSRLWPGKVVTELTPAGTFWEAEAEHQDYLQLTRMVIPVTSHGLTGSCRKVEPLPENHRFSNTPSPQLSPHP